MNNANSIQKAIIQSDDQFIRVVAGAGCGKTFTLVQRVINLITQKGFNESKFLIVTFTNKAKDELNHRFHNYLKHTNLKAYTYHSLANNLLRKLPDEEKFNFQISDKTDTDETIKNIFRFYELPLKGGAVEFADVSNFIFSVKAAFRYTRKEFLENFDNVCNQYSDAKHLVEKKKIFKSYLEYQLSNNVLDYEDLLNYACHFLQKQNVKQYWTSFFDYVFVDEFQDINHKQYWFIKQFVKNNLFIVGDPDQCIYEWRGAQPEIMVKELNEDYKSIKDFILNINYRSSEKILKIANKLIDHNKERIKKDLLADKISGTEVVIKKFFTAEEESTWIGQRIKTLIAMGENPNNIAILYRANFLARQIETSFNRLRIPYIVYGGISFFQRKEIKDCVAYLKLIFNPTDVEVMRIINTPTRGIGDKSIQGLVNSAKSNGLTLWNYLCKEYLENKLEKKVLSFVQSVLSAKKELTSISEVKPQDIKNYLQKFQYIDYIKNFDDQSDDRIDNLNEFINAIAYDIDWKNLINLETYLSEIAINADKNKRKDSKDSVMLMTIHSAKGLEFKNTFLPAWSQNIFPSRKTLDSGNLEEERRIAYVAITRAIDNLYISHFMMSRNDVFLPSIFLKELG